MKSNAIKSKVLTLSASLLSSSLLSLLGAPLAQAQLNGGNGLLPVSAVSLAADPAATSSPDDSAYAEGVRAINSGKWSDAIAIFSRVAALGNAHAEGALYWKAYAENKQGQSPNALDTCGALRRNHPGSSWIEECGALEIEIHAKSGQPVAPRAEQTDDLKLLALASLMKHDEKKALEQIDQIMNGDSSEKLKQGALYIMGEHHSDTIYPQIARLSFIDGDVRIQRGQEVSHKKDVTWEAAASGVPIESGYSIVTGDGRAEIELEDASVLYLAPNSVLTINDLSTLAGVPHTDLGLLSGTVSLHVHPYVSGETFLLRTPTDNLFVKYPMSSNVRLTSYLDGVGLAGFDKAKLDIGVSNTNQIALPQGQTLYFKEGKRILEAGPIHPDDFSSWDQWVTDRYAARTTALAEVAKEAGVSAPLPGMADMRGLGRFFACQPYGTCWEPNPTATPSSTSQASAAQQQRSAAEHALVQSSSTSTNPSGRNIQFVGPTAASGPPPGYADMGSFYPCVSAALAPAYQRAILPANAAFGQQWSPAWAWTVCHSGSWIYQQDRYVWVAGQRHHHPCVDWVKYGNTVAVVPIHPHDVKDHLPVNRHAPVFVVDPKNGRALQRMTLDTQRPVQMMREPPKEFRTVAVMPLPRAADPHMEGHQLHDAFAARSSAPGASPGMLHRSGGIPITFDHHSQNFMMPNHAMEGVSRPSTGFMPITNRGGDLQSHSGAFNGNGGMRGSYGGGYGGGGMRGGYNAGSSGGGSFHGGGGGGGFSGGAAMHGGGGAPAASVSAPAATSSGAAPK